MFQFYYKDGILKMAFGGGTGYMIKCKPKKAIEHLSSAQKLFKNGNDHKIIWHFGNMKSAQIWDYYSELPHFVLNIKNGGKK